MIRIVCLQKGNEDAPLYCLPTSSGSVGAYHEVAAALAPDHAIYGVELSARTPAGALKQYASLRQMAEAVAAELVIHGGKPPICLMGYSFAGHLATLVAQQLERCGRPVSLVVLIDTMPSSASFTRAFRLRHFIRHVGPWLLNRAAEFLRGKRFRWDYRASVLRLRRQHMFEGDTWFRDLPDERQGFLLNNLSLSYSYAFEGRYGGRILLLRPTGAAYGSPLRTGQLHDFGWRRVTGADVRVRFVPGDHVSCLEGANAVHLASEVRLALKDGDHALPHAEEEGNVIA